MRVGMKIAVIGCGVMGKAFARFLSRKHDVLLVSKNKELSQVLLFKRESLGNINEPIFFKHLIALSSIKSQDLDRIINVNKALLFLEKSSKFDLKTILKLHAILQAHLSKKGGKFRKKQNWIGPKGESMKEGYFFPPKPSKVKSLCAKLFINHESSHKDPFQKAALFFAYFLMIHPFNDANGRVARLSVYKLLKQEGYETCFLSPFLKKERYLYFLHLFEITDQKKWKSYYRFFLKALKTEAKAQIRLLETLDQIVTCVEKKNLFTKKEKAQVYKWMMDVVFKVESESGLKLAGVLQKMGLIIKHKGIFEIKGLYSKLK